MKILKIFNNKNNIIFNILIFFYLTFVFINYVYNTYWPFTEINYRINNNNVQLYIYNEVDIKKVLSKYYASDQTYSDVLNRECKISGSMHDRHKVRWVKNILLMKIFQGSYFYDELAPFYVNVLLHSFLLFLIFFLTNKTFIYKNYWNYLFLLYVTFIFQQQIGEYSYSIFEAFFLSLSLYASKNKKFILFFLTCVLATLNRESGLLISLTWLIFNNKKKYFFISLITSIIAIITLNYDILDCLIKPKFFVPLEIQAGQWTLQNINQIGFLTFARLLLINFIYPFGLIIYFYINSIKKNKIIILMIFFYFIIFLLATPLNHMAIRLILLPFVFLTIHIKYSAKKN